MAKPKISVIPSVDTSASVVERLEEALVEAKADKIGSIAIAVIYRDGSTGACWSKLPSYSAQIGAVTVLQQRLVQAILE
jgi:hypothetical protein